MKMRADNILVNPEPWTEAKLGSIILPDNQKTRHTFARGTVMAVGPGLFLPNNDRPPIETEVGEHILYVKGNSVSIIVNEKEMHIIREREMIAILEPGDFQELPIEGDSNNATN